MKVQINVFLKNENSENSFMNKKKKNKIPLKKLSASKETSKSSLLIQAKVIFLTFKGISDFQNSITRITKKNLKNFLIKQNQNDRKVYPEKYLICEEKYADGTSHFHVILVYPKRKIITNPNHYDYLGIHPNIQHMRNLKAALEYVTKEDTDPLTNMDLIQQKRVARAKDSSSLYQLLQEQMKKDPFNFDSIKYCLNHNITKQIYQTNYTKAIKLIKLVQEAYCNKLLSQKSGFKLITRKLIEEILSKSELTLFDSWKGYQKIVNYLNQIPTLGYKRPLKTMNLLITGPPSTGKTSLFYLLYPRSYQNPVSQYVPVYKMGVTGWFPQYQSETYRLILWNQAKLTSYGYDVILELLEGSPMSLAVKGGFRKKMDNPLIVMTSNMTLDQMIKQKFSYNNQYQKMAKQNLSVRVQNIIVPPGKNLFILQKLLVPA